VWQVLNCNIFCVVSAGNPVANGRKMASGI
jgi:hypothetical protein